MSTDTFEIIVKTLPGLEHLVEKELAELGATNIKPLLRGVRCDGNQEVLYKYNYLGRYGLRALKTIAVFPVRDFDELYRRIKAQDWIEYLDLGRTFAVDGVTSSKKLDHSHYLALRVKDGIADYFRDRTGRRPHVDPKNPSVQIAIHVSSSNIVTLSLDSSGEVLYKRGYRDFQGDAPLSEVLGAGLVALSGWTPDQPLYDGMCGSGTILIEAALLATNTPSQMKRKDFGFMGWKDHDEKLWRSIKKEADNQIKTDVKLQLFGTDHHREIIRGAGFNAFRAKMEPHMILETADFFEHPAPAENGVLIMNPPYDEKLELENARDFYMEIGNRLKRNYENWTAWVFSANFKALRAIGLRPSAKIELYNGPLPSTFNRYELFAGSMEEEESEGSEGSDEG